jgi:hypothetical protein
MNSVETIDALCQIICNQYNITLEQMMMQSKKDECAMPRQVAMALCYTFTNLRQQDIAGIFRKKTHNMVNYSMNQVVNYYKVDKSYSKTLDTIIYKLNYQLGTGFTFNDVIAKLNKQDVNMSNVKTHSDIVSKIKEIVEAQNQQLILILVQELKDLHSKI